MKKTLFSFAVLLIIVGQVWAQKMCLSSVKFTLPVVAFGCRLEASLKVNFDVIEHEIKNIRVSPADSISEEYIFLFDSCTISNMRQITFLSDKSNCNLLVNYRFRSGRELSNNFVELESDSVLNCVFILRDMGIYDPIDVKIEQSDSLTFRDYLSVTTMTTRKSYILVQRIFEGDKDSTIILRNNYPELRDSIYESAKKYTKESFTRYSKNSKFYFIQFLVICHIDDCEYDRIL